MITSTLTVEDTNLVGLNPPLSTERATGINQSVKIQGPGLPFFTPKQSKSIIKTTNIGKYQDFYGLT